MIESLDQLRELQAKYEAKVTRLRTQLASAQKEQDDIATAIRVIERLAGQGTPAAIANAPNENGAAILKFVGFGPGEALAPKEIQERLSAAGHDLNADLVRTQLWRMARRGRLESEGGKYWHPVDEPFGNYAEQMEREAEALVDQVEERTPWELADEEEDVPF